MTTFYRDDGLDTRAVALTPRAGVPFFGTMISLSGVYVLSGAVLAAITPYSTGSPGFVGVAQSSGGTNWGLGYVSDLYSLSSGGVFSHVTCPSGQIYMGLAATSGQPYFTTASGAIYTSIGGAAATGIGAFGTTMSSLAVSGSVLFALLSPLSSLATFNLAGATSGLVVSPITSPKCLAATSGFIALAGTSPTTISSGFVAIAADPVNELLFAGSTPSASGVSLWLNDGYGNFSQQQIVSGLPDIRALAWTPNGGTLMGCNPVTGAVKVMAYSFGVLSVAQTINIAGAAAVDTSDDNTRALVCSPTGNLITQLFYNGVSWAASGTLAIGAPSAVIMTSDSAAYVGCSSGIATLQRTGNVWSIAGTTALPIAATLLALDQMGNVLAAGPSGATSAAVFASGGTYTYAGGVSGLSVIQAQLLAADPVGGVVRVLSYFLGTVQQEASRPFTAGVSVVAPVGDVVLFATPTLTRPYVRSAPFSFGRQQKGVVSVYTSGAFATTELGAGHIPSALTFNPSGQVSVATFANELYTIATSGGVITSGTIAQDTGQLQSVPIGLSSLAWINGNLFGVSSLNEALLRIV